MNSVEPRRRTWPVALAVLAVALFYSHGLGFLSSRLPSVATLAEGTTVDLGRGATARISGGWSLDVTATKPQDTTTVVRDGSSFVLTSFPWRASEADLLARAHRMFEVISHLQLTDEAVPFRTATGLTGRTLGLIGPQIDGRLWIIVIPERELAIAARLRGPAGHGADELRDARAILDTLEVK